MSEPRMPPRPGQRPRLGAAWPAKVALLLPGLAACGSSRVTEPSTDLTGVWDYSYSTRAAQACGPPAPPGLRAGCADAGTAALTQVGARVDGTMILNGGCESCRLAVDSFGQSVPVTGRLRGRQLELANVLCRYNATVPSGVVSEVAGSVTCAADGLTQGTWRMTRKP